MRSRLVAALIVLIAVSAVAGTAAATPEVGDTAVSDCAATPPDDFSAPENEANATGWVDGYWYNEPIEINSTDGLSDDELDALSARTMARVESIRCLQFDETVPVDVIPREEFQAQQGEFEVDNATRQFDNTRHQSLFLVGADDDSVNETQETQGDSVLGYYSPVEDRIVLVSDDPDELQVDEITLAHEFVHALQDQQFDLMNYTASTTDGGNAENGLIEGDAVYVEYLYERTCDGGDWDGTCHQPESEAAAGGEPANMGIYFIMFQPYSDGPAWTHELYEQDGWDAVNAAYDEPPTTAEQIIHPDRYPDTEPRNVTIDDSHGEDWERIRPPGEPDHDRLGQAAITSMFVYPLYHEGSQETIIDANSWLNADMSGEIDEFDPLNYDQRYSDGWDGDRFHAYEHDDEVAYVWRTAWSSSDDADEFLGGYRQLLEYWDAEFVASTDDEYTYRIDDGGFAGGYHVIVEDEEVTLVHAPSVEELPEVYEAAEPIEPDDGNSTDENGDDGLPTLTPTDTPTPDERTDDSTATDDGDDVLLAEDAPGFGVVVALTALIVTTAITRRSQR